MNIKSLRKVSAIALAFSMSLTAISPVLATEIPGDTTGSVTTSLTRDAGSGNNPVVEAKWEANVDRYTDGDCATGAQLLPSGQKNVNKKISICAIVTDPDGLADINKVYADVFYPTGIAVGTSHIKLESQDGSTGAGCGLLMQEDSLTRLEKTEGYNLFCSNVRNNNTNLPTFGSGYTYEKICNQDGDLMKDIAAVYCAEKDLSYEDPAGNYRTLILAQDTSSLDGTLNNTFEYLPLTAFETDFNQVSYGNVKLNIHKIINGDLNWDVLNTGKATVRNIGNTRLSMKVKQNDMGFGKTDGVWNVKYDARVGSSSAYSYYYPEDTATLIDSLDLSEKDEMDFSVLITKFPPEHSYTYNGTMTLSAVSEAHLPCQG